MKDLFGKRRSATVVCGILSGVLVLAATGCQSYARITWDPPKAASVDTKTQLAVGDLSKLNLKWQLWAGRPPASLIGKHTWTVFGLPVGNLHPHDETPLKASFDKAIRAGLTAAGYNLVDAKRGPKNMAVLRGEINSCWWWSYSWLYPFVLQGGQNQVTLFLEKADGTVVWKHKFSRYQPGLGFGGAYGFNLMIKWSMTKLVKDIVRECSCEEFKAALRTG